MPSRRSILVLALLALPAAGPASAAEDFARVAERARGQTVFFNAWGGGSEINAYIAWAADELDRRHGVRLEHVKLTDAAEAVSRVLAEKAAGRTEGGSVDLIWINGENFKAMKEQGLLFGPFARDLPNFRWVDTEGKPTTLVDFTIPTEGYESPWGMAQFVMFYDAARLAEPPASIPGLAEWTIANSGRFTFPAPPNFTGTTFLKQLLYATIEDPARLQSPADPATAERDLGGVWSWLDRVRSHLWRSGTTYPASGPAQHQLLADGEVDLSMAFNPSEASALIARGVLPDTVRGFTLEGGGLANTHFLAIPFNAAHREGAMVVANFLLSPEAQAHKQDPSVWGDPTVLDVAALPAEDRARFEALELGPATLPPEELGPQLPEPHPSWTILLEEGWAARYAR